MTRDAAQIEAIRLFPGRNATVRCVTDRDSLALRYSVVIDSESRRSRYAVGVGPSWEAAFRNAALRPLNNGRA